MRKTTEELWKQALAEQTVDSDVPETFRRLVIENERECTEPVAIVNSTLCGVVFCETTGPLLPSGTKLFAFPPGAIDRDSMIEALQLAHDHMRLYLPHYTEKHNVFDTVTRALKSQPAAPDQRDEALRIARAALDELSKLGNGKLVGNSVGNVLASEAIAAIDKVLKEGK